MKTKKLKLEEPKQSKLQVYRKTGAIGLSETSTGTDITTTCTTVGTSTHFNKI